MSVTVVLGDDHPLVRQGVRRLLEGREFEILGEGSDGLEVIDLAQRLRPDIILLDLSMPTLNGLGAVRELQRVAPASKVIVLTMHTEEHYILEALRAGVKGCVSKTQAPEHLLQAIREVCRGGVYLSPSVSGVVVQGYLANTEAPYDPLTDRERQVLQLIAEGKTTKEVAVILGVSVKTAESHRSSLMSKLDIHSTAEVVRYAIRRGMVAP
ncbi:MAG TPA: response regulator transcription factor [Vicinamibacterales bacterium]|nr:response regulator transcription factor [Vicinamibacterales bacterium]